MKSDTDYDFLISKLPLAWKELQKHSHQRTAGIDQQSIAGFKKNQKQNMSAIRKALKERSYVFSDMRVAPIQQKGKRREILIATVSDRIVSKALLAVIEPKFAPYNSNCDYSRTVVIPGEKEKLKGVPQAALAIKNAISDGYTWILETDIKKFFDNVPKAEILKIVGKEVSDSDLMRLIKNIVEFQVKADSENQTIYFPYKGIAQGSSISPLLASIYLFQFDELIKANQAIRLVRYVDDFVVLCKDKETAETMYGVVKGKLKDMGLDIHELDVPDKGKVKTRIRHATQERFEFLGLQFNGTDIDIAPNKKADILSEIKKVLHTRNGRSYRKIADIERKLQSFIRQYRHPHYSRTKQSLNSITKKVHQQIEEDFTNELKAVFGADYYKKLSPTQQRKLLNALGVEISSLVK